MLADGQPLFRAALRSAILAVAPDATVREAGDLRTLRATLAAEPATALVLLDLAMPGVSGVAGLLYLRAQHPDAPTVVVSAMQDRDVMRRCLEAGAVGFIPKSSEVEVVREAIRVVLDGGVWAPLDLDPVPAGQTSTGDTLRRIASLTPQQLRVLMMLAQGRLNKQIAFELTVSEATVKAHVSAILQKLGVDSRTQAVIAMSRVENGRFPQPASA